MKISKSQLRWSVCAGVFGFGAALPALAQDWKPATRPGTAVTPGGEAPKKRLFLWGTTPTEAGELTPLFDGKTLGGWKSYGGGKFTVENGEIVAQTGDETTGWLVTEKSYGDFVLEAEIKNEGGNSGIQIRSNLDEKEVMVGLQIENDPSVRSWSGALYDQGRRAWLQKLDDHDAGRQAFKTGEWNHYRIEAIADRIRTWVNGVPVTDYVDSQDIEGVIGLQVHAGKALKVRYRNLKIKDLGRRKWLPLWDGKALEGWHVSGKGDWVYERGILTVTHDPDEPEYGHLVSEKVYGDLTVRLKFKALFGNSGLYFRAEEKGTTGMTGPQVELDATRDSGGIYETNGLGWLMKPTEEQVRRVLKPAAWNELTLSVRGDRIVSAINGVQIAQIKQPRGAKEGVLALQTYGGQKVQMQFKDLEILSDAEK